ATKDSDIDLLVVCRDLPRPQFERRARFDQATADAAPELRRLRELGHSAEMSVVLKNEQEALYRSPLYLDMTEDAVLLFDRGGFFASVLEGLRERMRSLGSRRVFLPDGSWYWDLKPDYEPGDRIEL
ncbi:MAG: nucleotidyltransferase domain-containing protein, partial [Myxococcota bacterium]